MPLNIRNREDWGARLPLSHNPLERPASYVLCMSTNGYPCYNDAVCKFTLRYLQKFHMSRKRMLDIRFSFMIGGNGVVYEGRGWYNAPLLPEQFMHINNQSVLIAFVGTYDEDTLPLEMIKAREELVSYGIENKFIKQDCKRWNIFKKEEDRAPDEKIVDTTLHESYTLNES